MFNTYILVFTELMGFDSTPSNISLLKLESYINANFAVSLLENTCPYKIITNHKFPEPSDNMVTPYVTSSPYSKSSNSTSPL